MQSVLTSRWKLFLLAATTILLMAALFAWSDYCSHREHSLAAVQAEVARFDLTMSRRLEYVVQDVLFLADSEQLTSVLDGDNPQTRAVLAENWVHFASIKRIYDQIRWIDETGMERIRINYSAQGAQVVPAQALQNKKGRYYFDDTLRLAAHQVGISPLDLNIEHGQVEQPRKPMIRIGTPVFDSQGNKRGILIVNYLANNLLDLLEQDGQQAWLLNSDGFWLKGSRPEDEWGFMFQQPGLTLGSRYPEAWQRIQHAADGRFIDDNGAWAFTTIRPLQHAIQAGADIGTSQQGAAYDWKLIRLEPLDQLHGQLLQLLPRYLGVTGGLLLLAFIASHHLARAKLAEQQAHERLTRTQYAMGQAGIAIYWVDRQSGRLRYVNEHAARMLGYSIDELLDLSICDLTPEFPREQFQQWATGQFIAGRAHFEARHRTRDGRLLPVEVVGFEALAHDDEPGNLICFVSDISTRKTMEDQLRNAKEGAEAASVAKSAFLANMSHEIRTPMNAVLGYAYLLSRMELPASAQSLISKIRNSGTTLLGIISDILDFSKIESGHLALESADFELAEVQRTVANVMSAQALSRAIELVITPPPPGIGNLIGDPLRLGQILINLTGNAIKFTDRGHVHVHTELLGETEDNVTLRFAVIDTGIGIAPERQQDIFAAFSQADPSTTRRFGGTGLGLSICSQLVHLMGGAIGVNSEPGKGSEFWFVITLRKGEPAVAAPAEKKLTVLIADDNDTARAALAQTVDRIGWQPLCVDSGQAAAELALKLPDSPPNVILLDWKMPGIDGLAAARMIRESCNPGPGPIIIMITGYMREELQREPDSRLADAILEKPVTISTLHDTVTGLLRQKAGNSPAPNRHQRRLAGLRALVVDDSDTNREVAQGVLEQEGVTVSLAANGQQALDWLQAHAGEVDVVLMDVQMPVLDGLQTTRQLRAMPQFADLPVVAMTAGVFKEQKDEALAAGMNDYIAKPLDVETTISTLQNALHWPAAAASAVAEYAAGLETLPISEIDTSQSLPGISLFHAASIWKSAENYRRFLRKFASEHADFVETLAGLPADEIASQLHRMRGAAGNLGLMELAAAAQELEMNLREGSDSSGSMTTLRQHMQQALASVLRYAGSEPPPEAETASELSPQRREQVASLLHQALQACDGDNPDPIIHTLAALSGLLPACRLQPLQDAVDDYDFRQCEERICTLATSLHIELRS